MSDTETVKFDRPTTLFYKGTAAGRRITEAHADSPFPDFESRLAFFYFYGGALAIEEADCRDGEELQQFMLGLNTVAPQKEDADD